MTIVEAYLAAIKSMEGASPQRLLRVARFMSDPDGDSSIDVSLAALVTYLASTDGDDVLRKELHFALAGWDALSAESWTGDTASKSLARRRLTYDLLGLDEATCAALDSLYPLSGDGSVIISDDFEAWYTPERRLQHEFYWRAYERQLKASDWSGDAIQDLDIDTTRVVERLSSPSRPSAYQAKGLVVGYVQSGKTANFTGVIAKAIDAGYRLVIVLTGTVDLLRKQTQRRLDMELVGIENIFLGVDPEDADLAKDIDYFQDSDRIKGKFLTHGFQPSEHGYPDIVRLTRHGADYKSLNAGITALELAKRNKKKPLFDEENLFASDARLAIVKKNASVLQRLVRDLKSIRSHLGEIPTLIIDDESDQASVNTTNPKNWQQGQVDRTKINGLISELLTLLPRAQYVGYTATPYANVFIDPSDTEDIFPKDFLLSLDRPMNYMGVADFHDLDAGFDQQKTVSNSNEKAFVRNLVASGGGADVEAELLTALDAFLLAGAIKLYREAHGERPYKHHTMLIHESVKMAQHRDLADTVRAVWATAGYMTAQANARLETLLDSDFRPVSLAREPALPFPPSFLEIKGFIGAALGKILASSNNPVLVVNGDKDIQQQNLDFDSQPIWRVLVGGTKLSRGFTVEGLTTSYYRRRTGQADTLMQMGRWFGFRRGYRDLVRLYIGRAEPFGRATVDLYAAFEATVRDEEAFRAQLRQYSKLVDGLPQITPRDIPPLVSQHLPTISPAAKNKMFNAELVLRRSPGIAVEPTAYPVLPADLKANYAAMLPIMVAAIDLHSITFPPVQRNGGVDPGGTFDAYVGIVPASTLLTSLKTLRWLTPDYFRPDLEYLSEITDNGVDDWVIIAPQTKMVGNLPGLGTRSVASRTRRRGELFGAISDPKHRPATSRIAGARDSWGDAYVDSFVQPDRGGVLIYPVIEPKNGGSTDPKDVVVAFTVFAPRTAVPSNGQVVQFRTRNKGMSKNPIVPIGNS